MSEARLFMSTTGTAVAALSLFILTSCARPPASVALTGVEGTYPPPTPDFSLIPTALPPNPIDFISEPGQFNVSFPCCDLARGALEQYSVDESPFGESAQCQVTLLPEDGASWKVQYCDLPPSVLASRSAEDILDWARDDALQDARAHLVEEASIDPGFEASAVARSVSGPANMRGILLDGTFRARVYLVGTRIYLVAARVYDANWGDRLALIDSFLDSFFVHPALTIPFEPTPTPP
jgi:hypothetical protein